MQEKIITTSCINYEDELEEYINNGWNVVFIPPIIIDENNHCLKEYPEDFLVIKKVLKKFNNKEVSIAFLFYYVINDKIKK